MKKFVIKKKLTAAEIRKAVGITKKDVRLVEKYSKKPKDRKR